MSYIDSYSKAEFIAKLAQDKKAEDILILDMRKLSNMTDFFVIGSGNSSRQVKAITDYTIERLKKSGQKIWHIEGEQYALWVLLDCGDVVAHYFHSPIRDFYELERLWADAPRITISPG